MKKNTELRNLNSEELNEKLLDLRKTQFKLRLERANGTLEKKHKITNARRDIARVKTLLSEKVRNHDKQ